jgi:hypothetical protein
MDLLNNSRKRRLVVGLVSLIAALATWLAFLLNRFEIASDLFVSGVLIIGVEVIYTMNRYMATHSSLPINTGFTRFLRASQVVGAVFFWGLALVLLLRGILTLATTSGS